jgi:hypothetical protein
MYAEYTGTQEMDIKLLENEEDIKKAEYDDDSTEATEDDQLEGMEQNILEEIPNFNVNNQRIHIIQPRLTRELKGLKTFYNPNPGENAEMAMLSHAFTVAGFDDGQNIPKSYKDATYNKEWKEWWTAICLEFSNMESKKVWEIHPKKEIPTGRKLIGNRWVFAKKDDGRFRARTVAKGFSQIPGKDFQENHAPVVNDTTFRITLILKLLRKLDSEQFDIETAFLYGDLDEEIWMELPEGYSKYVKEKHNMIIDERTHCVLLKKALYGLVQAARQWWKKFKEVMASIRFYPSKADPCLFIRQNKGEQSTYVIIYVDDGGIISTPNIIQEILKALSKDFKIKRLGKLEHFVGCHVIEDESRNTIWIHQPKLYKNLKEQFQELSNTNRKYNTPAAPGTVINRPFKEDPLISPEEQKQFRSGVGMLLYLVKHSRPDLANAVRDLSKVADGATKAHWKSLMRTINYAISTEKYGLKLQPKLHQDCFYLEGISDSEYAGDKESRISVYGYMIYFCGAPIAWKSKAGKSVTLSSTEAEYVAVSEVAKEILFAKQVLESMGIDLTYPIVIKCDNVGAIYLANNHSVGQRTKHIDTRRHFVREYIEDGVFKIIFVKSGDNDADIMTKNTTEELYNKHASKNVEDIEAGDHILVNNSDSND